MLFRVSDKIRGEIMIPSVNRTLVAGSAVDLNPEEYKSYDILTCIKKGYLIPEEEKTKEFTDFEKMNEKEIKIKNIGKNPLILRDIIMNPGDAIFISEEFLKNSYVQKAISIKALKVIKDKIDKKIIDEVKEILANDENEEQNPENEMEEKIKEEIKESDKTTMSSWDPHREKSLNKAESHKKIFGNEKIENPDDVNWIDKEENEQKENQEESKIIKKSAIKKKKSKKKVKKTTKKVAKKTNTLKPVGKQRTPPVDGVFSSDEFMVPSEENLAFELDSQGNFVGNKDISFVDDEQKKERIQEHPKLSENNSEVD